MLVAVLSIYGFRKRACLYPECFVPCGISCFKLLLSPSFSSDSGKGVFILGVFSLFLIFAENRLFQTLMSIFSWLSSPQNE